MARKGKPALHMQIVSDSNMARPIDTSRPLWEQQADETDTAYGAFWRYLNMPKDERSIKGAAEELNKNSSNLYDWSRKWSWAERVRAWDREEAKRQALLRSEESRAMADRHAQHAQLMVQALSAPAVALMRQLRENPRLMDTLLAPDEHGNVKASQIRDAFDLIVRASHALPQITGIERVARGEPQTIAEQRGDGGAEATDPASGMLDPARLISDPEAARLAGDLLARMAGAADDDDDEATGT